MATMQRKTRISDFIDSEQKEEVVHIQVSIPRPLYSEVKKIIDGTPKLSWQKVLLASVKAFKDEMR